MSLPKLDDYGRTDTATDTALDCTALDCTALDGAALDCTALDFR